MPKFSKVEAEDPAFYVRAKLREHGMALKYHAGFTRAQEQAFADDEVKRLAQGAAPLFDLPISSRILYPLTKLGCRTVEGAGILRDQGRRPYGIGGKSLPILDQAIASFRQQQS